MTYVLHLNKYLEIESYTVAIFVRTVPLCIVMLQYIIILSSFIGFVHMIM